MGLDVFERNHDKDDARKKFLVEVQNFVRRSQIRPHECLSSPPPPGLGKFDSRLALEYIGPSVKKQEGPINF